MATRKGNKKSPDEIRREIRAELRGILRLRSDISSPIQTFEEVGGGDTRFYVAFDTKPRMPFTGLKLGGLNRLKLPDERITDTALELAKAIWHLKDRLGLYAKRTNVTLDTEMVAGSSIELLLCADLANEKKHGMPGSRSNYLPRLDLVDFDFSNNGPVELYYNGATKHKEIIVTNTNPIPFTVDILINDGASSFGDVATVFTRAFRNWLPVINSLNILDGDDAEATALKVSCLEAF